LGVALVRTTLILFSVLALLSGCSKWGDPVPGTKMSGDLTRFLVSCALTRGGHPVTNGLSVIQARWTVQSNLTQHTVYVHGDHFDEIEAMLTQAFGPTDTTHGSSPAARVGGHSTRLGWYDPKQAGSSIWFSGDAVQTIVCINGPFSPRP
jgi:hypothetical protein